MSVRSRQGDGIELLDGSNMTGSWYTCDTPASLVRPLALLLYKAFLLLVARRPVELGFPFFCLISHWLREKSTGSNLHGKPASNYPMSTASRQIWRLGDAFEDMRQSWQISSG